MLLTLSIEIKKCRGTPPTAFIVINDDVVTPLVDHTNEFSFDVLDTDIVSIVMDGKTSADTEVVNGEIISDKAVMITSVTLEGLSYFDIKKFIEYVDSSGHQLTPTNYMHVNGKLNISISKLLQTSPSDLDNTPDLSFEQMIKEVFD